MLVSEGVQWSPIKSVVNKHSSTLIPTLFAPSFALMTNAAFSKVMVDVSEVIGDLVMPSFPLLVLLFKVNKVS